MIAIHHREGSFSYHWIKYCKEQNLPYKLVNASSNTIIEEVKDCDAFLWNWVYFENVDIKIAKYVLYAIEKMGIKVFPDINTCLFFDDKLGQKYLFDSHDLPFVKTHVFFQKKIAFEWINQATFPKVFKLRGGASSDNVWLVKSRGQARRITRKMFSKGIKTERKSTIIKERFWELKRDKSFSSFIRLFLGFVRYFFPKEYYKYMDIQRGYVYFQDFIPDMTFDIRIVVVGNKAFGTKRITRKGDFRASGSGILEYERSKIDKEYFDLAFTINDKLKFQSIAFDFIKANNKIYLIEVSYTYPSWLFHRFKGYYANNGEWNENPANPAEYIIENLLNK